jgi:hypothetical protein
MQTNPCLDAHYNYYDYLLAITLLPPSTIQLKEEAEEKEVTRSKQTMLFLHSCLRCEKAYLCFENIEHPKLIQKVIERG